MNICIIAMEYPFTIKNGNKIFNDCSAGGGAIMRDIAIGLQKRGHKVFVVSVTSLSNMAGEFYDQNVYVKKIYSQAPLLYPYLVTTFVTQLAFEENIDIIETNDFNPLIYQYIEDIPLLLRQHVSYAYLKYTEKKITSPYNIKDTEKLFRSYALLMADSISGVSEYIQSSQTIFHNIPSTKIYDVIHNGVSIPYKDTISNPFILFSHGTMSQRKGTLDICKTFSILRQYFPEIKLILIGNKIEYFNEDCKSNLDSATIDNIQCYPMISRNQCIQMISKYGIFISMSKMEGLSLALLEALALGKPSIVLRNGCSENIVNHGINGFVVNNIEEAVSCIKILFHDKELYNYISHNARERAKEFTLEKCLDKTENWYNFVIVNKNRLIKNRNRNYSNLLYSCYMQVINGNNSATP